MSVERDGAAARGGKRPAGEAAGKHDTHEGAPRRLEARASSGWR